MTPRTLKLLAASTAFVAAASAGNAATISTTLTATQYTSQTGAFNITGAGRISTTGVAAIEISSTSAASNTITVGTGTSVVASGAAPATIINGNNANASTTINISGTVSGVGGNTKAIDLSGMSNGTTVRNTGTISGSITLGSGVNSFSSTGTTSGTLTGGVSGDTFTFTGATHTGNIDYVSGADVIVISNSTINGNISNTGVGGATNITLTNATLNGNIADTAANDSDVLTINGANTFTTHGTISGIETVNLNTNSVLNHAISGAQTLNVAAGKTIAANQNMTIGGTLTNSGTLNVAAGKVVSADQYSSHGGILGIAIASSNTTTGMGQLDIATGAFAGSTSVTINMAENAGFIANGTSYTIVTGGAAAGNASLTTAANGVYRFSTAAAGNDLVLTVGRVSTSSVVEGADNKGAANVLDALGANAKGQLATIQGVIGSQANAAGVQNVLESLTPSIDGAGVASVNFAVDAGNQVSNRLASVRGNGYGVATGDAAASRHMWAQGFGSTLSQDDKKGARGYDADSAGASIGIDTDTLVDGLTTGVAITYGKSSVDGNGGGNASTDIDTYAATLYGSRVLDNGVFVNGQLGAGYNKYEMERTVAGIGQTKGDTDGLQASAKLETGRDFAFGGTTLTPLASLQYTYLDMDSYTETGAGGASLRVNPDAMSTVDAGIGGEASYAIALTDGGTLKPSVRAKYIYRMGDDSMATTSQFIGGGTAFGTNGIEADRSSVNLGAGLLLTTVGGTDLSLNYDADIRSSLTGHTGQIKARWAF